MVHSKCHKCFQRIRFFFQNIFCQSCALSLLTRKRKPCRKVFLTNCFLAIVSLHFPKFIDRSRHRWPCQMSAFSVVISTKSYKCMNRPIILYSIDMMYDRRRGEHDSRRTICRIQPCSLQNFLCRNSGDLLCILRSKLLYICPVFFKPVNILFHKLMVIQILFYHHLCHSKRKCSVCSRKQAQMDICLSCRDRVSWIYYNNLDPSCLHSPIAFAHRCIRVI